MLCVRSSVGATRAVLKEKGSETFCLSGAVYKSCGLSYRPEHGAERVGDVGSSNRMVEYPNLDLLQRFSEAQNVGKERNAGASLNAAHPLYLWTAHFVS